MMASLIEIKKKNQSSKGKSKPNVQIQIYDQKKKKILYEISHQISFSYSGSNELTNRIKTVFSNIKYTGVPEEDFGK